MSTVTPPSGYYPAAGTITQGVGAGGGSTFYSANGTFSVNSGTITSAIASTIYPSGGSAATYSTSGKAPKLTLGNMITIESHENKQALSFLGKNPVITTEQGDISLNKLKIMMDELNDLLCIIREEVEKNEKYPALKNAYEHYKLIRALVRDEDEDPLSD